MCTRLTKARVDFVVWIVHFRKDLGGRMQREHLAHEVLICG